MNSEEWIPHSNVTITVEFMDAVEPILDNVPLTSERLELDGGYQDGPSEVASMLGVADYVPNRRLLRFPIFGEEGEAQLRAMTNETLLVLSNVCERLDVLSKKILDERAMRRLQRADED